MGRSFNYIPLFTYRIKCVSIALFPFILSARCILSPTQVQQFFDRSLLAYCYSSESTSTNFLSIPKKMINDNDNRKVAKKYLGPLQRIVLYVKSIVAAVTDKSLIIFYWGRFVPLNWHSICTLMFKGCWKKYSKKYTWIFFFVVTLSKNCPWAEPIKYNVIDGFLFILISLNVGRFFTAVRKIPGGRLR